MVDSPSDAEVIGRSLDEPEAFGLIYDRHAATVLRFLGRRVGTEVAEGLVGELFRIAFERRKTFDTLRATALPWLYGIGANLLLKHRRGEARRLRASARMAADEAPDKRAGAGALDARLLFPRVADAIEALPDGEREAGDRGAPALVRRPAGWLQPHRRLRRECAALGASRYGRRPVLGVVGVLPVVAYFGMAAFFGWGGILFGFLFKIGRGALGVLFMEALNERIPSAFRATVISLSQLGLRAFFCLLGPLVGYGIDAWGLPSVLSALGILFSIVFVGLLLPVALRETAQTMKEAST